MASQAMEMLKNIMKQMISQGMSVKFDEDLDVGQMRAVMEAAQRNMPTDPGVTFEPCTLNGVEAELNVPENARTDAVIIHYHGGGFGVGNTLTSRGYASMLANETHIPVYTVSYRLAPENPYPAGADDCFAVYQAVLAKHPGLPVFIIGESADAHYCIVMALKAWDAAIQTLTGVILYSPPLKCGDCSTGIILKTRISPSPQMASMSWARCITPMKRKKAILIPRLPLRITTISRLPTWSGTRASLWLWMRRLCGISCRRLAAM